MLRLYPRLVLIAAAVTGLAGLSSVARADEFRDVEMHVSFQKTNFNDPVAVKKLYHKLKGAAYYLCEDEVTTADLQTCVAQKLTLAVVQINHQELTSVQEPQYLHPVELTLNAPKK